MPTINGRPAPVSYSTNTQAQTHEAQHAVVNTPVAPADSFVSSGPTYGTTLGAMPTSNPDLISQIANAPYFNAEEQQLMSKLPPEQQAQMLLQAKKQREALLSQTLTSIMNMKHEMLKAIAGNLRG